MLDFLDWKSRSQVTQRIREQLQAGALGTATTVIEDFVAQSRDDDLVQAACTAAETADLDWVGVCAEAIEADHRLRTLQERGCRLGALELGNQPQSRLSIVRHYYGPARVAGDGSSERTERRLGAYHGILDELMRATGLEQLAEVQLRPWPRGPEEQQVEQRSKMLAGHLLVLRFFGSVQRHAETCGLPVPARLQVGVQRPLGGEDALTQLEPHLSMELPCAVRPISAEVEQRLEERHKMHVAKWHENTDKLLRNLRAKFQTDGYAPSFMIPNELVETKQRLVRLESKLMHLHPFHRLTWRDFEALTVEVQDVRDRTAPAPIDPAPYR
jgi:hypothetical protein